MVRLRSDGTGPLVPGSRILSRALVAFWLGTAPAAAAGPTLIDAVKRGDVAAVRDLVAQKVDVNQVKGDGMTALHWAAYDGNRKIAAVLLKAGARVNLRSTRGLTPLVLAVDHADAALVRLLLEAGADPNFASGLGTTPLMRAAAAGDVNAVVALVDRGAKVNTKEPGRDHTALMFAAALNRVEVIHALVARGADPNLVSRSTANTIDLIDADGNPIPAESRTGETQRQTKGDGLAQGIGGRTALQFAAREGFIAAATALVEAGANINQANPLDGSTALVVAIANGHYDLAKVLLERGANPNLAMRDGLAALYATIDSRWAPVSWTSTPFTDTNGIFQQQTDYLDLMKALLARGADPNAKITKSLWYSPPHHNVSWAKAAGATAFWRAAQANDIDAMRLLISAGADPTVASADGTSPLAVSAGVGWAGNFSTNAPDAFLPATRFLLEEIKLDPNLPNKAGYTALMGAAWRGDNELIQYLVTKGAKLDVRNERGWSATDMANGPFIRGTQVAVRHPETIAFLKKLGAPDLVDTEDEEVLGSARRGNRRDADADPDADDAEPRPRRRPAGDAVPVPQNPAGSK